MLKETQIDLEKPTDACNIYLFLIHAGSLAKVVER